MNEELLDALEDLGAEVDDTLDRLMGDEEMYVEYLKRLPENENIKKLRSAVDVRDFETAEKEVHTLKGVALNLGLLPLVDVCMDLLLDLRAGSSENAQEQMVAIEENFQEWVNLLNEYKED